VINSKLGENKTVVPGGALCIRAMSNSSAHSGVVLLQFAVAKLQQRKGHNVQQITIREHATGKANIVIQEILNNMPLLQTHVSKENNMPNFEKSFFNTSNFSNAFLVKLVNFFQEIINIIL